MYLLAILGRRVLQIMATVLLVAVLVFTLMHMLPGDPAQVMLGDRGTTAAIAQLHHDLGLDRLDSGAVLGVPQADSDA